MNNAKIAVVLCVLAASIGCNAGRLMKPSEFDFLHHSVQWAYQPGSRAIISSLLFLPMEAPNRIVEAECGRDCVIMKEEISSSPGGLVVWRPKPQYRSLSLKDGKPVAGCAPAGNKLRWPRGSRLDDGLFVAEQSYPSAGKGIHAYGTALLVGKSEDRLFEVVRYKYSMESPGYLWAPGSKLMVIFPHMVLCIDMAMVPE